jgi:uncharacterized protein
MIALAGDDRAALAPGAVPLTPPPPLIWVITGEKGGDNGQVDIVADALGWPCQRKRLVMRPAYRKKKPRVRASLHHIDLSRSDPLEAPWPDMIITIGRRLSMAAHWIRRQSGARTKIVLVGKPSGSLRPYDLIIASAENLLPPRANLLPITLPLMQVNGDRIAAAAKAWRDRLQPLPRPLIALFIGGPTVPFVFKDKLAARIIETATQILNDTRGSVYIVTSPRTPSRLCDALEQQLPSGAHLYRWLPNDPQNPYQALLGLADGFVVTGDSISMMTEVVRLRRPLVILEPPTGLLGPLDHAYRRLARRLYAPNVATAKDRRRLMLVRALFATRIMNQTRDFRGFWRLLTRLGLAQSVDDGFSPPTTPVPDDLGTVVARIRALARPSGAEPDVNPAGAGVRPRR